MTCKVTRTLFLLPLEEHLPGELKALREHAQECAECQSELTQSEALDSELKLLPDPTPPVDLRAVILAKIERLPERKTDVSDAAPALLNWRDRSDSLGWMLSLVGLTLLLGCYGYGSLQGEQALNLTSSRIGGLGSLVSTISLDPLNLLLLLGMMLFLSGGLLIQGRGEGARAEHATTPKRS